MRVVEFLPYSDLVQIPESVLEFNSQAYSDTLALLYGTFYEFSLELLNRTNADYLRDYLLSVSPNSRHLVLGSGMGRDVFSLVLEGHEVIAVDFSEFMINILKNIAGNNEKIAVHNKDLNNENFLIFLNSLTFPINILAESVFQHVGKQQVIKIIRICIPLLGATGKMLFRLKMTPPGQQLLQPDGSDKGKVCVIRHKMEGLAEIQGEGSELPVPASVRYFNTWTMEEIEQLAEICDDVLAEYGRSVTILSPTDHAEKNAVNPTPDFITIRI